MQVKIFTDGASRGNPGEAGIGVVIYSEQEEKLKELAEYIGIKTNNVAEYTALIRGLEEALTLGATKVQVFADSELMVKQMRGEYKVKNPGLQPLYQKAKLLSLKFLAFQITHVLRGQNKEADLLANQGIDSKNEQPNKEKKQPISLLAQGQTLALEQISLAKGERKVFPAGEEVIFYLLTGSLRCLTSEGNSTLKQGEALVVPAGKEFSCSALENTALLKFSQNFNNQL